MYTVKERSDNGINFETYGVTTRKFIAFSSQKLPFSCSVQKGPARHASRSRELCEPSQKTSFFHIFIENNSFCNWFCFQNSITANESTFAQDRPFHGFWRHIDWGANKTLLLRNAPYISFQNRT